MNPRMSEVAEDCELLLQRLIAARTHAIERDILTGRVSTSEKVLERLTVAGDEEEVRAILWTAVVGGAGAVGADNMSRVETAIYCEAEELAEMDRTDIERRRKEDEQFRRIEQRVHERFFAHHQMA